MKHHTNITRDGGSGDSTGRYCIDLEICVHAPSYTQHQDCYLWKACDISHVHCAWTVWFNQIYSISCGDGLTALTVLNIYLLAGLYHKLSYVSTFVSPSNLEDQISWKTIPVVDCLRCCFMFRHNWHALFTLASNVLRWLVSSSEILICIKNDNNKSKFRLTMIVNYSACAGVPMGRYWDHGRAKSCPLQFTRNLRSDGFTLSITDNQSWGLQGDPCVTETITPGTQGDRLGRGHWNSLDQRTVESLYCARTEILPQHRKPSVCKDSCTQTRIKFQRGYMEYDNPESQHKEQQVWRGMGMTGVWWSGYPSD